MNILGVLSRIIIYQFSEPPERLGPHYNVDIVSAVLQLQCNMFYTKAIPNDEKIEVTNDRIYCKIFTKCLESYKPEVDLLNHIK